MTKQCPASFLVSTAVSRSAFNASAGMLSGLDTFPFFSFSVDFLISFQVGFLMWIGRGVSSGCMSGESSGANRFNSSEECSVHLLSCSLWSEASLVYP